MIKAFWTKRPLGPLGYIVEDAIQRILIRNRRQVKLFILMYFFNSIEHLYPGSLCPEDTPIFIGYLV